MLKSFSESIKKLWENLNQLPDHHIAEERPVRIAGENSMGLLEACAVVSWRIHRVAFTLAQLQDKLAKVNLNQDTEIHVFNSEIYWLEVFGILKNGVLDRATAHFLVENTKYNIGSSCNLSFNKVGYQFYSKHQEQISQFLKFWEKEGLYEIDYEQAVKRVLRERQIEYARD